MHKNECHSCRQLMRIAMLFAFAHISLTCSLLARDDTGASSALFAASNTVTDAYREILQRDPDPEGYALYTRYLLEENKDASWLRNVLLSSQEAHNLREEARAQRRQALNRIYKTHLLPLLILAGICAMGYQAIKGSLSQTVSGGKPGMRRLAIGILFLMLGQIILSLCWMFYNFNSMPNYGDTWEYLHIALSPELQLDMYRGCFFPLVLKMCIRLEQLAGIPFLNTLYVIQYGAGILASAFFLFIIYETFELDSRYHVFARRKTLFIIFFAVLLQSVPLAMHFHLSVLTDSLASSFSLAFIAALIGICVYGRAKYSITACCCFVLSALTRPERFAFLISLLIIVILFAASRVAKLLYYRRPAARRETQTLVICIAVLLFSSSLTLLIMKTTQTEVLDRLPPSVEYFSYERIVRNRLAKLYPLLPPNITSTISYEDAQHYDSQPNFYRKAVLKLVTEDSMPLEEIERTSQINFERVNQITWLALRTYPLDITKEIIRDVAQNLFSPYADMYAYYTGRKFGAIGWTESRMAEAHPVITRGYLRYYKLLFSALNLYLVFLLCTRKISFSPARGYTALVIVGWMLISALGYGLTGSISYHIRYTLPCYLIIVSFVYFMALHNSSKKILT